MMLQPEVSKQASQDQTSVETTVLTDEMRIDEIARMLGGRVSDQSRQHAVEMLESARRPAATKTS